MPKLIYGFDDLIPETSQEKNHPYNLSCFNEPDCFCLPVCAQSNCLPATWLLHFHLLKCYIHLHSSMQRHLLHNQWIIPFCVLVKSRALVLWYDQSLTSQVRECLHLPIAPAKSPVLMDTPFHWDYSTWIEFSHLTGKDLVGEHVRRSISATSESLQRKGCFFSDTQWDKGRKNHPRSQTAIRVEGFHWSMME